MICNLLSDTIQVIKSRRMRWAGYLACMVEYKINRFWLTPKKPHLEDLGIDGMGVCEHLSDNKTLENSD